MRAVMWSLVIAISLTAVARAEEVTPARVAAAITRGLARIERGSLNYTSNRSCFSCHHQIALPVLALAKKKGFAVSASNLFIQHEVTRETFRGKLERVSRGEGVGGANATVAFALFILEAAGQEPDETTDALVDFLTLKQNADGSWPAVSDRPPTEGSRFTNAALALRALRVYGLKPNSAGEKRRAKIKTAWQRGREWLKSSTPVTTEDCAFHLRALVEADFDRAKVKEVRDELIRAQRKDGGWAQLLSMECDAYATATVLSALHRAGVSSTDVAVRRGITYLIDTQNEDGSWYVQTRSRPVQVFFDNGDPGGKSQFISFAATNWALLALLEQFERPTSFPASPPPGSR